MSPFTIGSNRSVRRWKSFAPIRRWRLLNWMKCIPNLFKKNYCWIWIAVDRHGKRFVNCVLGARDTATGKQLWNSIQNKEIEQVMTDFWKPYEHFVPTDKHIQSKAETYTVEGYNSLFRHFLARLRRKTKCYSKSKKMLLYSVMLLMVKWNDGLLAILN